MADEVEEEVKKKGGNKLMIIVVAILMLVTGGFFGLKMKGGGAKAEPLKLGAPDTNILEVHEFLVNLGGSNDGGKFLRTDISVQTLPEFKKDEMDKYSAPVEDAINDVLCKYSADELRKPDFKAKLRKEIAKAANDAMDLQIKALGKDPPKADPNAPKHPEWDSQSGPILKVFFTTFAFQ